MRIALDIGHNCPPDTGAIAETKVKSVKKFFKEDRLVSKLGHTIVSKLHGSEHEIIIVTPARANSVINSLQQRVAQANNIKADLYISLHFNAFNNPAANGSEVYVHSPVSAAVQPAKRILQNICKLGYRNRGLKFLPFYVLRHTDMPAILIEVGFITSSLDMSLYNVERVADMIIAGILENENKDDVVAPIVNEEGKLVVHNFTYGKPNAQQAVEIDQKEPGRLIKLHVGTYKATLIAEEEGHLVVEIPSISDSNLYVYHEHARFETNG